jgi:hypothetical protein
MKLSFDALPRRAWDRETVKELLNVLQGELVKIFPLKDSWCLLVIAWLKEPSQVLKVLYVEFSVQEATMVDDALEPPSQKTQPNFKHRVLVHVQQVLDRRTYASSNFFASLRMVGGTGPAQSRDGGRCFYGSRGQAGV